jgi:hypothetical protein
MIKVPLSLVDGAKALAFQVYGQPSMHWSEAIYFHSIILFNYLILKTKELIHYEGYGALTFCEYVSQESCEISLFHLFPHPTVYLEEFLST